MCSLHASPWKRGALDLLGACPSPGVAVLQSGRQEPLVLGLTGLGTAWVSLGQEGFRHRFHLAILGHLFEANATNREPLGRSDAVHLLLLQSPERT